MYYVRPQVQSYKIRGAMLMICVLMFLLLSWIALNSIMFQKATLIIMSFFISM